MVHKLVESVVRTMGLRCFKVKGMAEKVIRAKRFCVWRVFLQVELERL